MTVTEIVEAAKRCGCSPAEMALCMSWMDEHGAPCEWDASTEADYKKAFDALHLVVAQ